MIFIVLFTLTGIVIGNEEFLNEINFYPKGKEDYFFKAISDLAIVGEYLFAVVNLEHKMLKFSIKEKFKYIKSIGKQGEGPGDLTYPVKISIWNGVIAVCDTRTVSFFDLDGNFLRSFRIFHGRSNFVYVNRRIYYLNSSPDSKYLIEVYNEYGKKISEFGTKFLKVNFSLFKGLSPFNVEDLIYGGFFGNHLLSDGFYIFYLNSKFGNIIKFKLDGTKLAETNVSLSFGEKGKKLLKENEKIWIETGLDLRKTNYMVMEYNLFRDAYLYGDHLYLMEESIKVGEKLNEGIINILVLDKNTLKLAKSYKIKKIQEESFQCLSLCEQDRKRFFISKTTEKGEIVISEYRERE